jgi:small subunit ribosomal protein S2
MKSISLEELLEAGCHFGHQVTRQNPKARDYIFEARNNIHIIDLEKTKAGLEEAANFVRTLAAREDSTLLILGAKRQAQEIVRSEVQRAKEELSSADKAESKSLGLFSITNRWIGGTLTNFEEVAKNFRRLQKIEKLLSDENERNKYTKKEQLLLQREREKLLEIYEGIKDMKKIPDALFIIDTHRENLAVREAIAMGVTTIGITDTNADPTIIDYAIPANDDAVGSIKLITGYIVDAWIEGKKKSAEKTEKKPDLAKASSDKVEMQKETKGSESNKEVEKKNGRSKNSSKKKVGKENAAK